MPFFFITFGLAWGILALYMFFNETMSGLFGVLSGNHPLFFLAVYAPAIAAAAVISRNAGIRSLGRYGARLLYWRCTPYWWMFLVFGIPAVFFAAAGLQGELSGYSVPFDSPGAFLATAFLMLVKGPVEELGWRGLALPLLQRRFAPFWAGLALGIIWAVWHLPAFLLGGTPQSSWAFAPFFIGSVAVSVIMTSLFNASRGSILLPALFHFQLINPLWPDAQPSDMFLFTAIAVIVTWVDRKSMFSIKGAAKNVIPAESG
ncbi:MAG: CPBP family glutamic-type intramembrane protease [Thermovirgaceae bacterium]